MSSTFMRKLMEATEAAGNLNVVENLIKELEEERQETIANAEENARQGAQESLKSYLRAFPNATEEDKERHKQEVAESLYERHLDKAKRLEKDIAKFQKIEDSVESIPREIIINPFKARSTASLGGRGYGGVTSAGVHGTPQEVLDWLKKYIPAKARGVEKNMQIMQKLSPEPITWQQGILTVTLVKRGRGDWSGGTPGANVLMIGETASGDDIRLFAEQGSTSEGGSRQAIVNGEVYKSGAFTNFYKEI